MVGGGIGTLNISLERTTFLEGLTEACEDSAHDGNAVIQLDDVAKAPALRTYNSGSTLRSYGVTPDYRMPPTMRAELLAAVPQAHRDFLASLPWVHEQPVPWAHIVGHEEHCDHQSY